MFGTEIDEGPVDRALSVQRATLEASWDKGVERCRVQLRGGDRHQDHVSFEAEAFFENVPRPPLLEGSLIAVHLGLLEVLRTVELESHTGTHI